MSQVTLDKRSLKYIGIPEPELAFNQGFLQEHSDKAMRLILEAMRRCTPQVMFSMPSVFYPNYFSGGSRMMRLDELRTRLRGLECPVEYYGRGHHYITGQYIGMGSRASGPIVQSGYVRGDVWHALQKVPEA